MALPTPHIPLDSLFSLPDFGRAAEVTLKPKVRFPSYRRPHERLTPSSTHRAGPTTPASPTTVKPLAKTSVFGMKFAFDREFCAM